MLTARNLQTKSSICLESMVSMVSKLSRWSRSWFILINIRFLKTWCCRHITNLESLFFD
ncbi:hypothetical protein CLU79DRAFT_741564 [Phycomyces nitens]|nr:hypothetical protein CLU79DRAFT_741564 [Phycomyces nitens]